LSDTVLVVLVAVAMAVGVVGTVVPLVPGLGLVWLAALVYGVAEGFGVVGWVAFVGISVFAAAGIAAGVVLPHRAARGGGAGRSSIALGIVTAIVGFFVVPVVGMPLGGVLGIFVGEALRTRDLRTAQRATVATVKGFGLAGLAQFAAGLAMVTAWLVWVVSG
jgi:uncharacterized protein YqgC (DUF456 family)